jgi:hypothetical protein
LRAILRIWISWQGSMGKKYWLAFWKRIRGVIKVLNSVVSFTKTWKGWGNHLGYSLPLVTSTRLQGWS